MNSHSVYGEVLQDWELNASDEEDCFLTHSLNEELEDMKERVVFDVRPVQMILYKVLLEDQNTFM